MAPFIKIIPGVPKYFEPRYLKNGSGTITGYGPQTAVSGSNWPSIGSSPLGVNTDGQAGYPGQWTDGYGNPLRTSDGGLVYGGGYNEINNIGSISDYPGLPGGNSDFYGIDNNAINTNEWADLQAVYPPDKDYWT